MSDDAISRRHLLKNLAAAGALPALALPAATAQTGARAAEQGRAVTNGRIRQSIVFWCFNTAGERWNLDRTCQAARELGCQSVEIRRRGRHDCPGRQEARYRGCGGSRCWLQGDVARYHHDRNAALGDGVSDRNLQRSRHLVAAGNQLAIVAALLKQRLRAGFLKIAGADLGRRYLRSDAEHGDP